VAGSEAAERSKDASSSANTDPAVRNRAANLRRL
jgi:hypothetical protein